MSDINRFWNQDDAARDAYDFLHTGAYSDVVKNAPLNNDVTTSDSSSSSSIPSTGGCTSSSQCPSGYGCVNGVCIYLFPQQGPWGGSSGAGECDQDQPDSPCNQGGSDGCQSTPTCGDGAALPGSDCCGTRCCRFGSASSPSPGVNCFCGECPELPGCNDFCASYLAANGEAGAGCTEGDNGNSCDSCTFCDGGVCVPLADAPCYCGDGSSGGCGPTQACNSDSTSPNFGECEDSDDCQSCVTIQNIACPCGKIIPGFSICDKCGTDINELKAKAQAEQKRRCNVACSPTGDEDDDDKCVPTAGVTTNYCCLPGDENCVVIPPCPEGTVQVGLIESESGFGCRQCQSYGTLPDECEPCDCNCDDDCPDCEFCNAQGFCETDPQCEAEGKIVRVYQQQEGWTLYCGVAGEICEPVDSTPTLRWTSPQISADVIITTSRTTIGTTSWSNRCDAPCPNLTQDCSGPRWKWEIFFDGVLAEDFTDIQCNYSFFGDGARWKDATQEWYYTVEYIFPS